MDLQPHIRRIPRRPRRAARLLAYANGGVWGVANGLVTTTLITYLATEYGAKGVAISVILAAPHVVGLLRQSTPRFIAWWGSRKWFCIQAYVTSATTLLCIPLVATPGVMPNASSSLVALIALWCLYQLLEYFGTVALWSWLGDVAPRRTRGRFLGVREAWLSGGRLFGMLASGLFTYYWPDWISRETLWQAYSICNVLGALMMFAAIVPLLLMPALEDRAKTPARGALGWRKLFFSPLKDRRFQPMIAYGCWLGAVNGLLGASQFFYSKRVLGLSLLVMLAMRCEIELGQTAISANVGRLIDRLGDRRVMMAAQLLVALSMVFYRNVILDKPTVNSWGAGRVPASHPQPWLGVPIVQRRNRATGRSASLSHSNGIVRSPSPSRSWLARIGYRVRPQRRRRLATVHAPSSTPSSSPPSS